MWDVYQQQKHQFILSKTNLAKKICLDRLFGCFGNKHTSLFYQSFVEKREVFYINYTECSGVLETNTLAYFVQAK